MADLLATVADLGTLPDGVTEAQAVTHLAAATAVVQEAAGLQRIVRVLADTVTLTGTTESWLQLPQTPVSAVTSVLLDGEPLSAGTYDSGDATYRVHGSRLWRARGWQTSVYEPSLLVITYDHGYADGDQRLELARSAVIGLAKRGMNGGNGVTREAIDDYQVAYESAASTMDASPYLRRALRRQYGLSARFVRIG